MKKVCRWARKAAFCLFFSTNQTYSLCLEITNLDEIYRLFILVKYEWELLLYWVKLILETILNSIIIDRFDTAINLFEYVSYHGDHQQSLHLELHFEYSESRLPSG